MSQTAIKLTGIDGVLETLRSLPAEVVSKNGGPVKLALMKGARYLRDKELQNLRAVIAVNGDESSGLLEKSIIASRGKAPASGKGERALVRVKRKTYPNAKGKAVTTLQTANLLEYGSQHQPATPWIRPAVQANGTATINVITSDLNKRLDTLVKKLAARNKR